MKNIDLKNKKIIFNDINPLDEVGIRNMLSSIGVKSKDFISVNEINNFAGGEFYQDILMIASISNSHNNKLLKIKEISSLSNKGVKVLLFSEISNASLYRLLACLGISAVMLSKESREVFIDVFSALLHTGMKYGPGVLELMGCSFPKLITPAEGRLVFDLLAGKRVTDIAVEQKRNIKTISTHKKNIMKRLNINSSSELSAFGGLLTKCKSYT